MGRITNLQNDIGNLQRVLEERNKTIASQNAALSLRDKQVADLQQKLKAAAEAAAAA